MTRDFTPMLRYALALYTESDILGIFMRGRRVCTRPAGDRLEKLKARLLRDGFIPNAVVLSHETGLVQKTAHRDIRFLRSVLPVQFDRITKRFVLKSRNSDGNHPKASASSRRRLQTKGTP